MRRSAVTMSLGSAAETSVSAEAAEVARRSQCPSSPCASRNLSSSSAARRASRSDRAASARCHLPMLHDTASASAGATNVRTANRPGVSMGSSGVEDTRYLHPTAYTRDTGKIAFGDGSDVRVLYVCSQKRRGAGKALKNRGRWTSAEGAGKALKRPVLLQRSQRFFQRPRFFSALPAPSALSQRSSLLSLPSL